MKSEICVENQTNSLKNPMTRMFNCFKVTHENHTNSHCIFTQLGHIHWDINIILQLQFISLDRNNLNHWHVFDKFFGILSF